MARSVLCISCNVEFINNDVYQIHKKSGHTNFEGVKEDLAAPATPIADIPDLPPGIPPEALPTPEFMETIKRIESDQATPPTDPTDMEAHKKEMEARLAEATPKPKEVMLTYAYTGDCPSCIKPVTTLELDVSNVHVVVAYCSNCNKQIRSREVIKLNG